MASNGIVLSRVIENISYTIERRQADYSIVRCVYSVDGQNKILLANVSNNLLYDPAIDVFGVIVAFISSWEDEETNV